MASRPKTNSNHLTRIPKFAGLIADRIREKTNDGADLVDLLVEIALRGRLAVGAVGEPGSADYQPESSVLVDPRDRLKAASMLLDRSAGAVPQEIVQVNKTPLASRDFSKLTDAELETLDNLEKKCLVIESV